MSLSVKPLDAPLGAEIVGLDVRDITAQARQDAALHTRTLLPEIGVEVRALLPQGVRSPRPVADFIKAFKAVAEAA